MTSPEPDIYETLRKIRYDATAIQAKVTDALNLLGTMSIPEAEPRPTCPECGVALVHSLAEHLENVHGADH